MFLSSYPTEERNKTQQKHETEIVKSKIGFGFCFWQLRSLCLKFENFHAYKRSGALPFAILGFSFFFLIGYQPDSVGPIIDLIVDKAANNHEPLVQCWFGFLKLSPLWPSPTQLGPYLESGSIAPTSQIILGPVNYYY